MTNNLIIQQSLFINGTRVNFTSVSKAGGLTMVEGIVSTAGNGVCQQDAVLSIGEAQEISFVIPIMSKAMQDKIESWYNVGQRILLNVQFEGKNYIGYIKELPAGWQQAAKDVTISIIPVSGVF